MQDEESVAGNAEPVKPAESLPTAVWYWEEIDCGDHLEYQVVARTPGMIDTIAHCYSAEHARLMAAAPQMRHLLDRVLHEGTTTRLYKEIWQCLHGTER